MVLEVLIEKKAPFYSTIKIGCSHLTEGSLLYIMILFSIGYGRCRLLCGCFLHLHGCTF